MGNFKVLILGILRVLVTCALAGRLTVAIKTVEEIKKMNPESTDRSQFGLFVSWMTGAIRTPEEIAAYLDNQGGESKQA